MHANEASLVVQALDLPKEAELALQKFPLKGSQSIMPLTDPLIYGCIMSAIDFTMNIEKVENPVVDRVKITMDSKFLR